MARFQQKSTKSTELHEFTNFTVFHEIAPFRRSLEKNNIINLDSIIPVGRALILAWPILYILGPTLPTLGTPVPAPRRCTRMVYGVAVHEAGVEWARGALIMVHIRV